MRPNRTRLQGWRPGGLLESIPPIQASGQAVEDSVAAVAVQCQTLPGLKVWSGQSHDAALEMFVRAKRPAVQISDAADAVADALTTAFYGISAARDALLNEVVEVESDDLVVNDSWVVLLKPVAMSRDRADELKKRQADAQAEVNRLLVAVDDADDAGARGLAEAASLHGFVMPQAPSGLPAVVVPGLTAPADEVPDPRSPLNLLAQQQVQRADAAVTVAETLTTETDREKVTTVIMQDGSKQVVTEWNKPPRTREDLVDLPVAEQMGDYFLGYDGVTGTSVATYDPDGNLILRVSEAVSDRTGGKVTNIRTSNGSGVVGYQAKDGTGKTGWQYNPDGSRKEELPPDAPFFTHPLVTTTGGLISGVQTAAESPTGLPGVGKETSSKIAAGAKWGGPALSVATGIYDVVTADGQFATCRALYSSTFGTVGGAVGGAGGGALGGFVSGPAAVVAGPVAAGAGSMLGTWVFGKLGDEVGQIMCAR